MEEKNKNNKVYWILAIKLLLINGAIAGILATTSIWMGVEINKPTPNEVIIAIIFGIGIPAIMTALTLEIKWIFKLIMELIHK